MTIDKDFEMVRFYGRALHPDARAALARIEAAFQARYEELTRLKFLHGDALARVRELETQPAGWLKEHTTLRDRIATLETALRRAGVDPETGKFDIVKEEK